MDISPVAVYGQQQALLQGEVATRMLKKTLDLNQQQAAALLNLIDTQNGVGQNLNVTA